MVLLQESSNYGFSVSKLLLGLAYLDGIEIAYSCPKAITLIREGLLSVDLWSVRDGLFRISQKRLKSQ
jgi:hypothetical protein